MVYNKWCKVKKVFYREVVKSYGSGVGIGDEETLISSIWSYDKSLTTCLNLNLSTLSQNIFIIESCVLFLYFL